VSLLADNPLWPTIRDREYPVTTGRRYFLERAQGQTLAVRPPASCRHVGASWALPGVEESWIVVMTADLPAPAAAAAAAALAVAGVVGVAEGVHWRASRRHLGRHRASEAGAGAGAVVVLGFPSRRGGRPHPLQHWRTEIAVRSLAPGAGGLLVFTGGGPPGAPTEAEAMARYAREVLGVPAERIRLETAARSTWENIAFALPFVESAETVAIASDPLHAARGRRYLHRQRPDVAARLVPADDYRVGDHPWLKVATTVYELSRPALRRLCAGLARRSQ
jgi:uncharacterized SAM-binding protein YcdF (DUF218 family)